MRYFFTTLGRSMVIFGQIRRLDAGRVIFVIRDRMAVGFAQPTSNPPIEPTAGIAQCCCHRARIERVEGKKRGPQAP
jgi:hypothetical protein